MKDKPEKLTPAEMGLTVKQVLFLDFYRASGNAFDAWVKSGGNPNNTSRPYRFLKTRKAIAYLKQFENEMSVRDVVDLKSETIADANEVLEHLTSVMRGQISMVSEDGEIIYDALKVSDRLKAAELLGKRYGIFVERSQSESISQIQITVDYGNED